MKTLIKDIINLIIVLAGVYSGMSWLKLYGMANFVVMPKAWVASILVCLGASILGMLINADRVVKWLANHLFKEGS